MPLRHFLSIAAALFWSFGACPAAAYDPDSRRFDELVLRMDARQAADAAQVAEAQPEGESKSWFDAWKHAWVQRHAVGVAAGPEMAFGHTSFSAVGAGPAPRGCSQTSGDQMSCALTMSSGRSGRISLAWDDRIIRHGLLYANSGFHGGLHSHYTVTEPEDDAARGPEDSESPRYSSYLAGVSGAAYARVGLTPLRAPDVLLTYSIGAALMFGTTDSPVGTIDYSMLSAYTGIEIATVVARLEGATFGFYASADEQRPVVVSVLSGPGVTKLRPSQVTVSAGCRVMVAL